MTDQERENLLDESPSFYEESAPEPMSPIEAAAWSVTVDVRRAEASLRAKGFGVQSYTEDHGSSWTFVVTAPYTKARHVFVVDRLENAIPVLRAAAFAAPDFQG